MHINSNEQLEKGNFYPNPNTPERSSEWGPWVIGAACVVFGYYSHWALGVVMVGVAWLFFWSQTEDRKDYSLTHAEVTAAIDALSMKGSIPLRLESAVSPRELFADETDARNDKIRYRQDLVVCICSNRKAGTDPDGNRKISFILLYKGKQAGEEGVFYTRLMGSTSLPVPMPEVNVYWNDVSQDLSIHYDGSSPFWPVGRHPWKYLVFSKVPE